MEGLHILVLQCTRTKGFTVQCIVQRSMVLRCTHTKGPPCRHTREPCRMWCACLCVLCCLVNPYCSVCCGIVAVECRLCHTADARVQRMCIMCYITTTATDDCCACVLLHTIVFRPGSPALGKFYIVTDGAYQYFWRTINDAVVHMGFSDLETKMHLPWLLLMFAAYICNIIVSLSWCVLPWCAPEVPALKYATGELVRVP